MRCDLARGRYLDYKYKMEFDEAQLTELFAFAKTIDLQFFASVWDKDSCDVMTKSARRRAAEGNPGILRWHPMHYGAL